MARSKVKALLIAKVQQPHQLRIMQCVAEGFKRHSIQYELSSHYKNGNFDFVVCWGDKLPEVIEQPRLILEAGYINGRLGNYVQRRLAFVSAGWNGLHGRADEERLNRPPDRYRLLEQELQPWKKSGDVVLICGQHPGDACSPPADFWQTFVDKASKKFDKVIFRPHPLLANPMRALEDALSEAKLCITWNSTSGVEALFSGVPVVALDRGSICWHVASHSLDEPLYTGSRKQWAYNLAYRQFTHDEFESGLAWNILRDGYEWTSQTQDRASNA